MAGYHRITWKLVDHLCSSCGGRILMSVAGAGMTPGGNPIYRCADCGKSAASMGPQEICWCGFSHRGQNATAYMCLPYSILNDNPLLITAFKACGCDPERGGDVGIMLEVDFRKYMEKKNENDIHRGP